MPTWTVNPGYDDTHVVSADYIETSETFVDFMQVQVHPTKDVLVLRLRAEHVYVVRLNED